MPSNLFFFVLGVLVTAACLPLSSFILRLRTALKYSRPELSDRVPCPCCRYPTLNENAADEICELCRWQDDGQNDGSADEVWGGPNGDHSLITARASFRAHRSKYDPSDDRYNSPLEHEVKALLMTVFDQLNTCAEHERKPLENAAICLEGVLYAETCRQIAKYEATYRHET